jgi:hypothetical protein
VDKVNKSHENIGNADKEKIIVLSNAPRIPDYQEETEPNHNAEELCKRMKDGIAEEADKVKS